MNAHLYPRLILAVSALVVILAPAAVADDQKLKIFILAGQSNMVGHASPHTIATLLASDDGRDQALAKMVFKPDSGLSRESLEAQLAAARQLDELSGGISNLKIKELPDGAEKTELEAEVNKRKEAHEAYKRRVAGACAFSDRVYINSVADESQRAGPLGVGFGSGGERIGPEYGFGLSIAEKIDGPILLIKTSWGGKSLNYDFRPPSASEFRLDEKQQAAENAGEIKANAGRFYRMMSERVHAVIDNLAANHPAYNPAAGHEIAGFVWFQGFNDQFSEEFRNNYRDLMVTFIKDVRADFKTPDMPFVIGVLGTGVTEQKVGENGVSLAQRAAAQAPEFKGNVVSVESYKDYSHFADAVFKKGWPEHYFEWDTVGSDRPYHYLGSGGFFVRLGDSFATAMAGLMRK